MEVPRLDKAWAAIIRPTTRRPMLPLTTRLSEPRRLVAYLVQ
jgi:hypothetical protein